MRIELDKPLTKTKLNQALKMIGSGSKKIKIIMGTEVFDVDTIVSKNDVVYLCTDSKETSKFFAEKVIDKIDDLDLDDDEEEDSILKHYKDYQDPPPVMHPFYIINQFDEEWEKYREEHGLSPNYIGDTPCFERYKIT